MGRGPRCNIFASCRRDAGCFLAHAYLVRKRAVPFIVKHLEDNYAADLAIAKASDLPLGWEKYTPNHRGGYRPPLGPPSPPPPPAWGFQP